MHIINYCSQLGQTPYFKMQTESDELIYRLDGNISLSAGKIKCIGYFDGKKRYNCPNRALNTKQCPTCKYRDISKIYTRYDFKGYENLEQEREKKLFSIYLTTFGSIVKAGITENQRVEQRIYEQGGGYYVEVAKLNGKEAYDFESLLHNGFEIKGAVLGKEKIKSLNEKDEIGLEKINEILEILNRKIPEKINKKIEIKKHEYITPKNFIVSKENKINGKIFGWRGRLFFIEQETHVFAYDSGLFIGREVDLDLNL